MNNIGISSGMKGKVNFVDNSFRVITSNCTIRVVFLALIILFYCTCSINAEYTCFGISASSGVVCKGHGACIENDVCCCATGYTGLSCDTLASGTSTCSCPTDLMGNCILDATSTAAMCNPQYSYESPDCSSLDSLNNPLCKGISNEIIYNLDADYELNYNFDNLTSYGNLSYALEKSKPINLLATNVETESIVRKKGGALRFGRVSPGYLVLDKTPLIALKNNFTISFWLKIDQDLTGQVQTILSIIYAATQWTLTYSNGKFKFDVTGLDIFIFDTANSNFLQQYRNVYPTAASVSFSEKYRHVFISKSSIDGLRMFIDKVECSMDGTSLASSKQDFSKGIRPDILTDSQRSSMGFDLNTNSYPLSGYIDELHVYFSAEPIYADIKAKASLLYYMGHGCHGKTFDEFPTICRGGECIGENECSCIGYYRKDIYGWCNDFDCFGLSKGDSKVCSGKGTCSDIDTCICNNPSTNYGYNCSFLINPSPVDKTRYGEIFTHKWKFNHKYLSNDSYSLGELRKTLDFQIIGGVKEYDIGGYVKLNGSTFIDISNYMSPFRQVRNNFALNLKIRSSILARSIETVYHELIHVDDGAHWRLFMTNKRQFFFEMTVRANKFAEQEKITLSSPVINPLNEEDVDYNIVIKKSSTDGLIIEINNIIAIYDYRRIEDLDKFVDPQVDNDQAAIGYNPKTKANYFEGVLDRLIIWKFNTSSIILKESEREWLCQGVDMYEANSYCTYNGICIGLDECRCSEPYHSTVCDFPIYTCFGINGNTSEVCSGRGKCVYYDNCTCNPNYEGTKCENAVNLTISDTKPICPLNMNGGCSQTYDDSQSKTGYSFSGTIPSSDGTYVPCQYVVDFVTGASMCAFQFVRSDYYLKYLRYIQKSVSKLTFYDFNHPMTNNNMTDRIYYLDKNYNFTSIFYNANSSDSFLPGGGYSLDLSGKSYAVYSGYSMFTGLSNDFSVAFWLKLRSFTARQTLVSVDDDTWWELFFENNNLNLRYGTNVNIMLTTFTPEQQVYPFYLAFIKSPTTGLRVYINTTQVTLESDLQSSFAARKNQTETASIGMSIIGKDYFLDGLIENFAVGFFEYLDYHIKKGYYSAIGCHNESNPYVCNQRGVCIDKDMCECDEGYSGTKCERTTCYGIFNDRATVCSGHGSCFQLDNCTCSAGYSGLTCAIDDNYVSAILASYNSSFTLRTIFDSKYMLENNELRGLDASYNLKGYLPASNNVGGLKATLSDPTSISPYNIFFNNFEVDLRVSFHSFEGNQTLLDLNNMAGWKLYTSGNNLVFETKEGSVNPRTIVIGLALVLPDHMYEIQIDKSPEDGLLIFIDGREFFSDPSITEDLLTNRKLESYVGDAFLNGYMESIVFSYNISHRSSELWQCSGIRYDSPLVCSGKGTCLGRDVCECIYSEGVDCEIPFCFNISASNTSTVCSGHGECHATDECRCEGSFTGIDCRIDGSSLFGYNANGTLTDSMDPQVFCSENNCSIGNNTCAVDGCLPTVIPIDPTIQECLSSVTPSAFCKHLILELHLSQNTTFNITVCEEGYYADSNNTFRCKPKCFDVEQEDELVCSGHGACKYKNFCFCYEGYGGDNCQVDKNYTNLVYDELATCGQDTFSMAFVAANSTILLLNSTMSQLAVSNMSVLNSTSSCAFPRRTVNDFAVSFKIYLTQIDETVKPIVSLNNLANWDIYLQGTKLYLQGTTTQSIKDENLMLTPMIETREKWYQVLVVKSSSLGTRVYLGGVSTPDYVFENYDDYLSVDASQNTNSSVGFSPSYGYIDEVMIYGIYGMSEADIISISASGSVFKCFGTHMDSASVCNSNGACNGFDTCICNSNYTGSNCEIPVCFGISSEQDGVCSGKGVCVKPDTCECNIGYFGSYCQTNVATTTCADVNGNCTANNSTARVGSNFTSPLPDCTNSVSQALCGKTGPITQIPSVLYNISTCKEGYYGDNCSLPICFGIKSEDSNVCSGAGNCTMPDFCKCLNANTTRRDCGVDTLFIKDFHKLQADIISENPSYSFRLKTSADYLIDNGDGSTSLKELGGNLTVSVYNLVLSNGSISFLNGSGLIGSTKDASPLYMFTNDFYVSFKINVKEFKDYNPIMNVTSGASFSIYMTGTTLVIEGQTIEFTYPVIQTIPNEIELLSQPYSVVIMKSSTDGTKVYVNDHLRFESVFSYDFMNTRANQSANLLIGIDMKEGQNVTFAGTIDEIQIGRSKDNTPDQVLQIIDDKLGMECAGVYLTESNVCNSNGKCFGYDVCVCNGNYTGSNCEIPICYGIPDNAPGVCSGQGHCEQPNKCACKAGFVGSMCQVDVSLTTCADPEGNCTANNVTKYFQNETFVSVSPDCNNIQSATDASYCNQTWPLTNPSVLYNISTCREGYYGNNCSSPICFGIKSEDSRVCSGNGNCTKPDFCKCFTANVTRRDCGVDTLFLTEISDIQTDLKSKHPNYSFRLKTSLDYMYTSDNATFMQELGGNLTIAVNNLIAINNTISFQNGSQIILNTKDVISPLYLFTNDFFISFSVTPEAFTDYNPIMNISSGASFSIYMTGTTLVIEGQTKEFPDTQKMVIPNEIELLGKLYSVTIIKSTSFGTKVYINDKLCLDSPFSYDFINTLPNQTKDSTIGFDTKLEDHGVHQNLVTIGFVGSLDEIHFGMNEAKDPTDILAVIDDKRGMECVGVYLTAEEACNSNGKCFGYDVCVCNGNYTGSNCEIPICYGIPDNAPGVCSGQGHCEQPNKCACKAGFVGSMCQVDTSITTCADPEGNCTANNVTKYFQNETFVPVSPDCNNIQSATDASYCNQTWPLTNPSVVFNISTCKEGYYGNNCSSPICFGIKSEDSRVCSGNGNCTMPDFCKCLNSTITRRDCGVVTTFMTTLQVNKQLLATQYPNYSFRLKTTSEYLYSIDGQEYITELGGNLTIYVNNLVLSNNSVSFQNGSEIVIPTSNATTPLFMLTNDFFISFDVIIDEFTDYNPIMNITSGSYFSLYMLGTTLVIEGHTLEFTSPVIIAVPGEVELTNVPYTVLITKSSTFGTKVFVNGKLRYSTVFSYDYTITRPEQSADSTIGYDKQDGVTTAFMGLLDNIQLGRNGQMTPDELITIVEDKKGHTCFGIYLTESNVCNSNGKCFGYDVCVCNGNYTGSNCEIPSCFGIAGSDITVCSGQGHCEQPNKCACKAGFVGSMCQVDTSLTTCADPEGNCTANNVTDYFKDEEFLPQQTDCENIKSLEEAANCGKSWPITKPSVVFNISTCKEGYYGDNCSLPICFGIKSEDSRVCSGNGNCTMPDFCKCFNSTISRRDCGVDSLYLIELQDIQTDLKSKHPNYSFRLKTSLDYMYTSDNATFMQELGGNLTIAVNNLIAINNTISFQNGSQIILDTKEVITPLYLFTNDFFISFSVTPEAFTDYNPIMNISSGASFSIYMTGTTLVIEGQTKEFPDTQKMVIPNEIELTGQTYTVVIMKSTSFGTKVYINDKLCLDSPFSYDFINTLPSQTRDSTIGFDVNNGTVVGFVGSLDEIHFGMNEAKDPTDILAVIDDKRGMECSGVYLTESNVCNSNGKCFGYDVCVCNGNYTGSNCEIPICYGIPDNAPGVCSGNGDCEQPNKCACKSGFIGSRCQVDVSLTTCADPEGNCTANNVTDYFKDEGFLPQQTDCENIKSLEEAANCGKSWPITKPSVVFNISTCKEGYYGDNCSLPICFGIKSEDSNVCSGNGNCTMYNFCKCFNSTFSGKNCQIDNKYVAAILNSGSTTNSNNSSPDNIRILFHNTMVDEHSLVELGRNLSISLTDLSIDSNSSYISLETTKIILASSDPSPFSPFINDYFVSIDLTITHFNTVNPILSISDVASIKIYLTDQVLVIEGRTQDSVEPDIISIPNVVELEDVPYSIMITKSSQDGTNVFVNGNNVYHSTFSPSYLVTMPSMNNGSKMGFEIIDGQEYHLQGQLRSISIGKLVDGYTNVLDNAFTCNGVNMLNPSVCNTNGECFGLDTCVCNSNYTGSKCDIPVCFELSAEDNRVCSGHGYCEAPNTCACSVGFVGVKCSIDVENSACKGQENCTLDDPSSFFSNSNESFVSDGPDCSNPKTQAEVYACGSTTPLSPPSVVFNVSTCKEGFYGDGCKYPICYGVQYESENVCSGHGNCSQPNFCKCRYGFSGVNCQIDDSYISQLKEIQNTALSQNPYYRVVFTPHVNFISYNTSLLNSSHLANHSNTQNAPVVAVLQDLASRANLLIENPSFNDNGKLEFGKSPAIFDTLEDESPLAMFSDEFYLSFKINVASLNGTQPIISLNDGANWKVYLDGSTLVMEGNSPSSITPTILKVEDAIPYAGLSYQVGIIKSYNTRVLVNGDLKGTFDDVPAFLSSNPALNGESFIGYDLVEDLPTYLNGTLDSLMLIRIDPIVSDSPTSIASTITKLKLFTCFGISNVDNSVCNGHGNCFGEDKCHCNGNYTGEECETPICYGISAEDASVCSGRGVCSSPDKCECKPSFIGSYCQVDSSKTTCTSTDGSCVTDDPGTYFTSTNSTPTLSCAPFCQTISTLSTTTTITSVTLRDGDRVVFALAEQPIGYPKTIINDKVVIDRDSLFQMVIKNATISDKGAKFNGENSFLTSYLNSPFDIKNDFSYTIVLSFDNTTTSSQPIVTSNFLLEKTPKNSIKYTGYLNADKSNFETIETEANIIPSDNSVVAVTLVKSKKNGISIYVNGLPVVRLATKLSLTTVTETYFGFSKNTSTSLSGYVKYVALVAGAFDDKQAIQDFADYTTCFGISTLSSDVCSGHGTCVYTDNCECKKGYVSNDCSLVATSQEYDFSNMTLQGAITHVRGYLVQEGESQNIKVFNEILECDQCSITNGLTSNHEGLYFDGISSKIDIAHDSNLVFFHNDFTVTLWLKKEKKNGNSTQVVIYIGSPSYWQLVASEETNGFKLILSDQYTPRTVTQVLEYDLFYFVSITKDSAYGLSVYINKEFTNNYKDTEGYYTWRRTIDNVHIMSAIGYNPSTRSSYFSGTISKIRFDSAVLSPLAINSTVAIENSIQSIESRFNKEGPVCNNIPISTPALQCTKLSGIDNSGGDCIEFDTCKCASRYYGKWCQDYTCFDVMNNETNVCYGKGHCLYADKCDCSEYWSGLNCNYPVCFGHNDTSACNMIKGWGECTSIDVCTCSKGYTGTECETPICFGIPNTEERKSTICSSHGNCMDRDNCDCFTNWVGAECNVPVCNGKNATNPDVCSRHGFCNYADYCICNSRYYGYDCEFLPHLPIQKVIPFNSFIITTGGKYLFGEGNNDEIVVTSNDMSQDGDSLAVTPNSKISFTVRQESLLNRPLVFQPFDRVLSNNFTVIIRFQMYGSFGKPQALLNFASGADWRLIYSNNSLIVQSNNVDGNNQTSPVSVSLSANTFYNVAISKDSQKGLSLFIDGTRFIFNENLVEDWSVMNVSLNTLNTIGYIPSLNEYDNYRLDGSIESLELSLGETLPDIFLVVCNGKRGNDTNVCSGSGLCEFDSTCTCDNVHDGINCEYHKCFGISSSNASACNRHGSCVSVNTCNCTSEYSGPECQYPICFNIPSDHTSTVCSSRGSCVDPDVCICTDGYYGSNCEVPMCSGVLANDSSACSGNGQCIAHDTCICSTTFTGSICSIPICYGLNASNHHVCSSQGVCIAPDTCQCNNNTDGADCSIITCSGLRVSNPEVCGRIGKCIAPDVCEYYHCSLIESTQPEVCSSRGKCIGPDRCECDHYYFGDNCQNWTCVVNNISDCSNRGSCDYANHCICSEGHVGDACEISICYDILSNDSIVCSGNGKCVDKDTCSCDPTYTGENCSIPICFGYSAISYEVCSTHGSCDSPNNCTCELGFFAPDCSLTTCFGVVSNESIACGRIGKCIAPDVCEPYSCFGVESNETDIVCSSRGLCIGSNTCECEQYYFGDNCQNWTCVVNNISDCSHRGSCDYANHCICYEDYIGSACEVSRCFNVLSNDSTVCTSHGSCVDTDKCECISTYVGSDCAIPICYGFNASDSQNVCSGRGLCSSPDVCECSTGFTGENCEFIICNGIPNNETNVCERIGKCIAPDVCENYTCYGVTSNDSSVCSTHGLCVGDNNCECTDDYSGFNCQLWPCNVNNITNCSYHGHCDYANHCTCSEGYTGSACEIPICFSILANSTTTCSSHGSCVDKDTCECISTYVGSDCSIPICYGFNASDSQNVCSGRGVCSLPDTCECSAGFTGTNCEFIICNGIPNNETIVCGRIGKCIAPDVCENYTCYGVISNDSSVCSTHGLCVGDNNCECEEDYSGYNCQLWPCNVNNITNCSNHGHCDYANHCTCSEGYTGSACEIPICFSILANSTTTCSSHGSCVDKDTCECISTYVGSDCSIPICYGFNASDSQNVCSGRGLCSSPDVCECSTGFTGENCEFTLCYGIPNNETNVCGRIGKCIAPDVCEKYTCYGVISNDSSVCSTHGLCVGNNTCECIDNYSGFNCQLWPCIVNNITNCSNRGHCDYANHCTCSEGYTGSACEVSNCFGILSNDSTRCSSHGDCVDRDVCSCDSGYNGQDCAIPICYGFNASDSQNVCSGRGICSLPDTCECSAGFTGTNCEFIICYGIPNNETNICNGHGNCTHPDNCECNGYIGNNCTTPVCYGLPATDPNVCAKKGICNDFDTCNWFTCYGLSVNDSQVCSGSGVCVSDNNCKCSQGYTGEECQYAICYEKFGKDACNRGHCTSPNNCTCDFGYEGIECNITTYFDCANRNNCSAHGSCISQDVCVCSSGYRGENCSIPVCFNNTLADACSSHGECLFPGVCSCKQGYAGKNCEYLDSSKSCSNVTVNSVSVTSTSVDIIAMDVACSNLVVVSSQKLSELGLPSDSIIKSTTPTIFDGTYYLTVVNYADFSVLIYTQLDITGSISNWKYLATLTEADQIDKIFIMNSMLYGITTNTNNLTVTTIEFYGSLSARAISDTNTIKTSMYDNKRLLNHTFSRETVKDLNVIVANTTFIAFTAYNRFTSRPALIFYNARDRTMSIIEFPDKTAVASVRALVSATEASGIQILIATITDQSTKLFISTLPQQESTKQDEKLTDMKFEQVANYPSSVAQFSEYADKINIIKLDDETMYIVNTAKNTFIKFNIIKKTSSDIGFTERSLTSVPDIQSVYRPKLLKITKNILPLYTGTSIGMTFDSFIPKGSVLSANLNTKVSYPLNNPSESALCKNYQVCMTTSDWKETSRTTSNKKPITFYLGLNGMDTSTTVEMILYDNSIKKIEKISETRIGIFGVFFANYPIKVKYEYFVNEILVTKIVDATYISEDYVQVDMILNDLTNIGFISVQVSSDDGHVYSPKSLNAYVMFTPSVFVNNNENNTTTTTTTGSTVVQEEEKSMSGVLTFLTNVLSETETPEEENVDPKTGAVVTPDVKPVFIPMISKKTGEITIKVSVGFVNNATRDKCSTNSNQVVKSVIPTTRKFTLLEKRVSIEFAVAKPETEEATLMEMLINDQTSSGYFSSSISIRNGEKYFNSEVNLGPSFGTNNISTRCDFKEGENMKLDMKVTHSFSQLDYSEWSSQDYKDWKATLSYTIKDSNGDAICNSNSFVLPITYPQFIEKFSHNYTLRLESSVTCAQILNKPTINIETDLYNIVAACKVQKCVAHATLLPNMESANLTAILAGAISGAVAIILLLTLLVVIVVTGVWYYRRKKMRSSKYTVYDYAHNRDDLQDAMNDLFEKMNSSDDQISSSTATTTNIVPEFEDDEDPNVMVNTYTAWM